MSLPTELISVRLSMIRERRAAISPGTWHKAGQVGHGSDAWEVDADWTHVAVVENESDAEFIANASSDIDELLRLLDERDAEIWKLNDQLEMTQDNTH